MKAAFTCAAAALVLAALGPFVGDGGYVRRMAVFYGGLALFAVIDHLRFLPRRRARLRDRYWGPLERSAWFAATLVPWLAAGWATEPMVALAGATAFLAILAHQVLPMYLRWKARAVAPRRVEFRRGWRTFEVEIDAVRTLAYGPLGARAVMTDGSGVPLADDASAAVLIGAQAAGA